MSAISAGYKQTEVGVIPQDWLVKQLGQLITSVEYGSSAKSNAKGRIPVLRMGNLQGGKIDWNDLVFTDDDYEIRKYSLVSGDVLFNRTNTTDLVGKTSIYEGEYPAIFAGYLIRINVDRALLDPKFLNYVLNTEFARKHSAKVLTVAIGQANINGQKVKTYPIPIPPTVEEQRAIAAALSDVDALLAKLDQFIAKKRDLKQAAMQQLLTGKKRLPGFSGAWEVKQLGDVAQLKNGYAFQSSTYTDLGIYKVVTIANVQDGYMTVDECNKVALLPQDIQQHQRLDRNDILISMTGNVGRVCRVIDDDCLLNQRVGKLVSTGVDDGFLFALLTQRKFLVSMGTKAKGGAQGNLAKPDITEFDFLVPSDLQEQTAIATVLSDMDAELAALETRRDKTRALKQGMMQELLTGRIRLV